MVSASLSTAAVPVSKPQP